VSPIAFGVGSYAFSWAIGVPGYPAPARPLDITGLVDAAAALEVPVLQICDNLPLDGLDAADLTTLRLRAAAAGMRIEAGTRGSDVPRLRRYLEIAVALGSPILRTLLTPKASAAQTLAESAASIRAVLPAFEAAGVVLAIENYEYFSVEQLRGLVDEIASPCVAVCLDPVNNFGVGQDTSRAVETLAPVAAAVHLKDFRVSRLPHTMGYELTGTPAGSGLLDVSRLLAAVGRRREVFSVVLEQWVPWQGTIEATVALERRWLEESTLGMRRWGDGS
jgi:3-oxoisoapionate decarboxylase